MEETHPPSCEPPKWDIPIVISSPYFPARRLEVCYVDIGVVSMGLVYVSTDLQWLDPKVTKCECVNLCTLDRLHPGDTHNEMADKMERFFARYAAEWLDSADHIFIERQPPQGFKCVEQLLYSRYRHKVHLLHPRSFQSHFRYSKRHGYDYDQRKQRSVELFREWIANHSEGDLAEKFDEVVQSGLRAHDVADGGTMARYVAEVKRSEYERRVAAIVGVKEKSRISTAKQNRKSDRGQNVRSIHLANVFDRFKYRPRAGTDKVQCGSRDGRRCGRLSNTGHHATEKSDNLGVGGRHRRVNNDRGILVGVRLQGGRVQTEMGGGDPCC